MRGHVSADQLADLMERPRRSGPGWTAKCPIHDDRLPSLRISPGKKGTVIHCHAGCRPRDILAVFGIDVQQLFYDYREGGGSFRPSWQQVMRDVLKPNQPVDVWEPDTLADVMRGTFHATDLDVRAERMAAVGAYYGGMLELPFEDAFRMWHVTADGPVFEYLRAWFVRSDKDWREVKPAAMQAMWTYWKRARGEGARWTS